MNVLDKIIEVAGKVQQVANILAPGVGGAAGVGVYLAKALRDQWNAAHPEQLVELPGDAELIQRLADTSTRVVTTGVAFLEAGE